jgi:hypothetical protein
MLKESAGRQMPDALAKAMTLDRTKMQAAAELNFSATRMARLYASLYERVARHP